MSNKPITIRVSTVKLLEALNKALAERKQTLSKNEKEWEEYDKAVKEFRDSLGELFRSGKGKVTSVSKETNWRDESGNKYALTVDFPASVKAPQEPKGQRSDWSLKAEVEELENAIAILNLSDEEYASTSTYKGVARFIK